MSLHQFAEEAVLLAAKEEPLESRVARLEERTDDLEKWIDVLKQDIHETNQLLATINDKLDQKLDQAILSSRQYVQPWVHYLMWALFTVLGVVLGGHFFH